MTGAEPKVISAFQNDPNKLNSRTRMAFSPDGKVLVVSNNLDYSALASAGWVDRTSINVFDLSANGMTQIAKLKGPEVFVWRVDPQRGFLEHLRGNEGKPIKSFAISDEAN